MNKLFGSLIISFLLLQFFVVRNIAAAENLEDNTGGKRDLYAYSTTSDGNYDTHGYYPFIFSPNDLILEQPMFDPYKEKIKLLEEENKNLHKIISEQAKEIDEKEDIKIKITNEEEIEKENSYYHDSNIAGLYDNYSYIYSQSELLKHFNDQKSKSDEINRLNDLLSQQAKQIEKKDNALIKEKKESTDLLEEKIISKYLLSLELKKKEQQLIEEQQKKQEMERKEREDRERIEREKANESKVARETIRIVKQTNNEVKRFIRKF